MQKEPQIQDVLEAVQTLATQMDRQFGEVRSDMDHQFTEVRSDMDGRFTDVRFEMSGIRGELLAVRSDMSAMKSEIITEIDHFAVLANKQEAELAALHDRCDRIESVIHLT